MEHGDSFLFLGKIVSLTMNLFRVLSVTKVEFLTTLLTFLMVFILTFGSRQVRLSTTDAVQLSEPVNLILHSDMNLDELSSQLDSLEVNFSSKEMAWATRLLGWRIFKKGSYELEGTYSYDVFLSKLALGIQDPVSVVILPGISKERFSLAMSNQLEVSEEKILSLFSDSLFLSEVGFSEQELFGRMLPETYLMYWTTPPKDVIRRVLREFNSRVTEIYADSAIAQGKSISKILTMASIVEWEAKLEEEKSMISGLYWNRLERRMRLEADPTVNFALGERRRLLFEDYRFEHPYNTYLNRGLPPGPITNPSLSTIEATLFPAEHDFLYMVANPEGGHEFSRTFAEHQVASERWRKWLREQYRIKRARERDSQLN